MNEVRSTPRRLKAVRLRRSTNGPLDGPAPDPPNRPGTLTRDAEPEAAAAAGGPAGSSGVPVACAFAADRAKRHTPVQACCRFSTGLVECWREWGMGPYGPLERGREHRGRYARRPAARAGPPCLS